MHRLSGLVLASALVASGALLPACGNGGGACRGANCGNSPDLGVPLGKGLQIVPSSAQITVNGMSGTQQFQAYWGGQDVTNEAVWATGDKSLGVCNKGLFTSNFPLQRGGDVAISAVYKQAPAGASLTINYVAPDVIDKGAAGDASMWFNGGASADPTETPQIIYPFDSTMMPRNIEQVNFQWTASTKSRLFRIHVVGAAIDSSFYLGQAVCTTVQNVQQCKYQPTDGQWQTVAVSAKGQPVTVTISAVSGRDQPVADSTPLTMNISPEDVKGGLYYFSPSINGLKRLPFGAAQATNFVSFPQGSGNCAGCHAISRDGKKVAATFYGGDGTGGAVDGTNGKKYLIKPEPGSGNAIKRWNFATYSPDGKLLLTNWAGVLTLRDGETGAKKFDVPELVTGGKAIMPEWSPDGKRIVYVQVPPDGKLGKDLATGTLQAGDWVAGNTGNIATLNYENGAFTTGEVIVPSVKQTEYHYYPSWSPDSEWILFVTARWPGSSPSAGFNLPGADIKAYSMSYDQDTARLRLVQAAANSAVIELTNATHAMNKTTSWPKFAPFIQAQGTLVFITFSAKFNYGFVVTDGKTPQLWMSAIDLMKAKAELGATDPSYPPFWLPFQDPTEKNHSGIWTNDVACAMDLDCPAEFSCMNGNCVPNIPG